MARPESTDVEASSTPSARSLARPATTSAAAAFSTPMSRRGPALAVEDPRITRR